jgi:multidrug efflux pump subunit AcrA (membrane-fusion protein)
VQAIWDAPANPAVPGVSVWVSARGPGLAEGSRLLAFAGHGAKESAVFVPDSAVVVSDDRTWCFVEQPAGTYRRAAVATDRPVAGGYAVTDGVRVGDRLVVHGAGLLWARAMGSAEDAGP